MRMFLYYALHSAVNTIKKLFRTWVVVFFLVCLLFGVLFGLGGAFLGDLASGGETETQEVVPPEEETPPDPEKALAITELIVGGLALFMFCLNFLTGDKSGNMIFTMTDVNLLFPAPKKPQSILLFKLMTQMGALFLASFYMLFQLPNLVLNAGLDLWVALSLLAVWFLILTFSKLLSVLAYTVASTHQKLKKFVTPLVYAVVILIAGAWWLYLRAEGTGLFPSLISFFNSRAARLVPVWGWLKAIPVLVYERNIALLIAAFAGLLAVQAGLIFVIWNLKADFYEDALSKAGEAAAKLKAAEESAAGGVMRRTKDRTRALDRDMVLRGNGASVFFWKSLYNRFRFAYFHLLTKTTVTYLLASVGLSLFARWVLHSDSFLFFAIPMAVFVFFRSFGNPIIEDVGKTFFHMIPESPRKLVLYSTVAGTANCALDLLPAYLFAIVFFRASPVFVLIWLFFTVTLDFYSAAMGMFVDLSLSEAIPKMIKTMLQISLIYLSAAPAAILLIAGGILGKMTVFLLAAALVNLAIGLLFTLLAPIFLTRGK